MWSRCFSGTLTNISSMNLFLLQYLQKLWVLSDKVVKSKPWWPLGSWNFEACVVKGLKIIGFLSLHLLPSMGRSNPTFDWFYNGTVCMFSWRKLLVFFWYFGSWYFTLHHQSPEIVKSNEFLRNWYQAWIKRLPKEVVSFNSWSLYTGYSNTSSLTLLSTVGHILSILTGAPYTELSGMLIVRYHYSVVR